MGGRVKGGPLSQDPRAVARREETRLRKLAKNTQQLLIEPKPSPIVQDADATTDSGNGGREAISEPIGVFTASKKPEIEAVAAQKYHCANCQGEMSRSDVMCPWCEVRLVWEGIA